MANSLKRYKKIVLIILIPLVGIIITVGALFGISYGYLNRKNIRLDFNENETYQTFKYFGASSCWNGRLLGEEESDDIKNEFISLAYSDEGLSLDVFRYNLGAGSYELDNTGYSDGAKTKSFFITENYIDNSSFENIANYDISRDGGYLDILKLAILTGNVKKVVIFSNSPHYLLTKNRLTHGSSPHENNLLEENYQAFSHYVLICSTLIDSYIKSLGYLNIEIYISPVNEPQWKWDGVSSSQEGCHFDAEPLAKFYDVFYKSLKEYNKKNNTSFNMDIYESGNYKLGLASSKNKNYFKAFSKYKYFDEIQEISMHSYSADDNKQIKRSFYNYFKKFDKDFVMSEYCIMQYGVDTSIDMGLRSAKVLMQDLNILNATEWHWWLAVAFGGFEDGLFYFNRETKKYYFTYRYYMLAQFMKYIDTGDVRIRADVHDLYDLGGVDSVGFKKEDGTIVVIVINDNNSQKNITIPTDDYTSMKIVETYENNYLKETEKEFSKAISIKPNSVTTIIMK